MNKRAIVEKILAALTQELEGYARSARAAHAEAIDEQNKAENKYDTRGLEASYLARGQSRQAAETRQSIQQYESLALRPFTESDPIDLGALVELTRPGERTLYFVGPSAGGAELETEGEAVLVITPQSPLGRQLAGHRQGERLEIAIGGASHGYLIAAVH